MGLLAAPSDEATPVEGVAAKDRHVEVLLDVVPLLLALPIGGSHVRGRVLFLIFAKYVLKANRAILLVHVVFK